jgi:AcrR family transcriptional regulator
MPKVVDHQQRRRELGEAVWRVIRTRGMAGATVRAVAQESGWSTGALRHYFASQSELIAFAMRLVIDRVTERVIGLGPFDDLWEGVETVLSQVIPLDAERSAEFEVWIVLTGRALTDPVLRELLSESHAGVRNLCHQIVQELANRGPRDDIDVELETERLQAVVDGLSLHAVLAPETTTPERVRTVLRRHLTELVGHRAEPAPAGLQAPLGQNNPE